MSIQKLLSQIKSQTYYSNCFMFENEIFDKNDQCSFENVQEDGVFCFFKNSNYNFKHLNFFLTENAIEHKKRVNFKQNFFVTEIISAKEKEDKKIKSWLLSQDNFHYRTFFRMLRTDSIQFDLDYSKVQHPEEDDFEEIILYLEKTFDLHTERIPNLQKLKQIQKSCYIIKEENQIAAVLITEMKGKNQELYFMVTLPNYEGKGYGSILMTYILNNPDVQRWIIWVDESNVRAIEWYYKIGYKKDKLINNIYISKNIMNEKIQKILADTRDEFDFNDPAVNFIEAGYLDSFDIISLVVDLEAAFDVKISGALILPENFRSIPAIANLIQMSKDAYQV